MYQSLFCYANSLTLLRRLLATTANVTRANRTSIIWRHNSGASTGVDPAGSEESSEVTEGVKGGVGVGFGVDSGEGVGLEVGSDVGVAAGEESKSITIAWLLF